MPNSDLFCKFKINLSYLSYGAYFKLLMKQNAKESVSDMNLPRFISNSPCGDDLFEGKAHQNIAKNIASVLENNENCHIIGIEGSWGSGKSNLVKLVEKETNQNNPKLKYHFFLYDAWGFQNDFQRRAILESLTAYLVDNEKLLNPTKWNGKLLKLLSRKRNVGSKVVKELNAVAKIGVINALLFPAYLAIYNRIPQSLWKTLFLTAISAISIILIFIFQRRDMKKYGESLSVRNFFKNLFYSFLDYTENKSNVEQAIKYETIYETEPSSRDFKNWMQEIDRDLKDRDPLVIVFDNMDRLPAKKVQELWAAINSFFSECTYKNIKVIIPFDREHIRSAFKGENLTGESCVHYGDDFIDKTFNAVFRVTPPIMTNWQKYFKDKWHEAFGTDVDSHVLQIYDLLNENQTPRKIIAFINEFVGIKQLSDNAIPDNYIAIFIFGRTNIHKNPGKEILTPTYLGALEFLYNDDDQLPKYMSALYYQLPPENALDVVYTEKIKKALDNNNPDEIADIKKLSAFYALLQNAIIEVSNIPNAIMALDKCLSRKMDDEQQKIWDCIYKKATRIEKTLQEYQKILVQRISQKNSYLQRIINEFYSRSDFNVVDYYKSLKELKEVSDDDLSGYIQQKDVEPQDYIAFMEEAKESHEYFKIYCPTEKIDAHLSTLDIDQLRDLSALQFGNYTDKLPKYAATLEKLVDQNIGTKENISVLFERLKEIQKPVKKKIPDSAMYSLFQKSKPEEDFYYDLVCMRFAKGTPFTSSNDNIFNNVVSSHDETIIKKVSERLEYYITYDEILINLKTMGKSPLYTACAKELTEKSYGMSKANIVELLKNYKDIKENLDIESDKIIGRFDGWAKYAKQNVAHNNVFQIPVDFFIDAKDIDNDLTAHCKKVANEYLAQERGIDEWKSILLGQKYEYELLLVLEAKNEECFNAFKALLVEYAENPNINLSKDLCERIITLALKHNRSLKTTFNGVRDVFCSGKGTMTTALFSFFSDWIFAYADLDRKEVTRTIFTPQVLEIPDNITFILNHEKEMLKIIKASGEEADDFKNNLSYLIETKYSENEELIKFAKKIGISIQKTDSENEEQ